SQCSHESKETCGTTGTCDGARACERYPDGTECSNGLSCYGGKCGGTACDGDHTVKRGDGELDCTPFRCSEHTDACFAAPCHSNAQCVSGYACTASGKCNPIPLDDLPVSACAYRPVDGESGRAIPVATAMVIALAFARRRKGLGINSEPHPLAPSPSRERGNQ